MKYYLVAFCRLFRSLRRMFWAHFSQTRRHFCKIVSASLGNTQTLRRIFSAHFGNSLSTILGTLCRIFLHAFVTVSASVKSIVNCCSPYKPFVNQLQVLINRYSMWSLFKGKCVPWPCPTTTALYIRGNNLCPRPLIQISTSSNSKPLLRLIVNDFGNSCDVAFSHSE